MRIVSFVLVSLVLATAVLAQSSGGGGGGGGGGGPGDGGFADMNPACREGGFSHGVAQFQWKENQFVLTEGAPEATLTGTIGDLVWTSPVLVDGYVLGAYDEESEPLFVFAGFSPAKLTGTIDSTSDIRIVTLCANNPEVPEFGLAAGLITIAACSVLLIRRR